MSSSMALRAIPFLFDRPKQPLFVSKEEVTFDVPSDYLPDRYKEIASTIQTRFPSQGMVIPIQNVRIPDISQAMALGRHEPFTVYNPMHRECAKRLIDVLMGMPDANQFLSACAYIRDRVNPYLFVYAASVVILHRTDTRGVQLPSHCETFPDLYLDGGVFTRAKEEVNVLPEGSRRILEIPRDYTASDLDAEHKVAYWREDVGLNLHHWHWHLVYPFDGPLQIVQKDRRGELFYYMHQQIMGRYNFERLSNSLQRVARLIQWREPIREGYYPKLDSQVASRNWPSRQPNTTLADVTRNVDQLFIDLQDMERWRDRIFEAIQTGTVNNGQQNVRLTEETGIDVLGNIMEASSLSINRNRYGNLHNSGHLVISYAHDPDGRYLESFGVMGSPTTAMRDPAFYLWHAFVDDIFQEFKNTLPPYSAQQLNYDGIRISGVEVSAQGIPPNEFSTFWQQSDIDLSKGLDFAPRGSIFARLTHLQHAPFTYRIRVTNSGAARRGTVRIFMSPKFDERGVPFQFGDQRGLMIELDKFTVNLNAGTNNVTRRSSESSVTIPFEQTFRNLSNQPESGTAGAEDFNYCGCGWPDHLLIPKGTADGMPCQLFVMITNYADDMVTNSTTGTASGATMATASGGQTPCDDARSYCGLRNSRYPDRRAMGFPFDRPARNEISTLRQFVDASPNMFLQETRIRFNSIVVANPAQRNSQPKSQVQSAPRNPTTSARGGSRTGGKRQ